jgi:riboflavin biosynthesis pyrimidine reductase
MAGGGPRWPDRVAIGALTQTYPPALVDEVLAQPGRREQRTRLLPTRMVDLETLGADVAGQYLRRGLVDEILVYVLPVLLDDGIRFSPPGVARIDLEPVSSTRSGAVTILRFRVRK